LPFNKLWILLAAMLTVFAVSCDRGATPEQPADAACVDHIYDEAYQGRYRAVFGFGEGVYPALRLFLDKPGRFNVAVALNGPTDAAARLADVTQRLQDFDNWPADLDRATRIAADRDLIAALGNPFYVNGQSMFYPSGAEAADFLTPEPQVLPPLISPDNPAGLFDSVTVIDESGEQIDYALAHDLNGNGRRDAGEPFVLWVSEPFDDSDEDGLFSDGESYDDIGIDGVAGTGDYGEGNGTFDANPRVAAWLAKNPLSLAQTEAIDIAPGYAESIYLDALTDDPWGFNTQIAELADVLDTRLDSVSTGTGPFCITNQLGRYDALLGNWPVFTEEFWLPEKYAYFELDGANLDVFAEENEALLAGRLEQALRFLSMRMPNGHFNREQENQERWQVREFFSETLQTNVKLGMGFPAGYFTSASPDKSFPVVYVFHDRLTDLNDWRDILAYQSDLATRQMVKQALIVVLDGTRAAEDLAGYHHYVDQAAGEFGGAYGEVVEEAIAFVEGNFRFQTLAPERDDDDD
jgi:hypothetical protein